MKDKPIKKAIIHESTAPGEGVSHGTYPCSPEHRIVQRGRPIMDSQTPHSASAVNGFRVRDTFPGKEFTTKDEQRLATQISRLLNYEAPKSDCNLLPA